MDSVPKFNGLEITDQEEENPGSGRSQRTYGYRFPGYAHDWTAAFVPEYNQIWTSPDFAKRKIEKHLPEEIIHANTVSRKPAQIYPLVNYLTGANENPWPDRFADIVEAVFFAFCPYLQDKPLLARHLPRPKSEQGIAAREDGKRILKICSKLAKYVAPGTEPLKAAYDALWGVTGFLSCICPYKPGQLTHILDIAECFSPPNNWTRIRQIFEGLLAHSIEETKQVASEQRAFSLARPNDPHKLVSMMLEFTEEMLKLGPDRILPVFPTLLGITTLELSSFIPLIWLRKKDSHIEASADIFDNTATMIRRVIDMEKARERLGEQSDCPTGQFHREFQKAIISFVANKRPQRPAQTMQYTLELLPKLAEKYLMQLWKKNNWTCRYCQAQLNHSDTQKACERILTTPTKTFTQLACEMDHYEAWLVSSGLQVIQQKTGLKETIKPYPSKAGTLPVAWQQL